MTTPFAFPRGDRVSPRSFSWLATAIPVVMLASVAVLLIPAVSKTPVLSASESVRLDEDHDGLTDFQESIIGTNPDLFDTDDDGVSDLEEIARNSDPLDVSSLPGGTGVDVGMYVSLRDGLVLLNSAVFVPNGELLDLSFYFGAVLDGHTVFIPGSIVANSSRKFIYPTIGGDHVVVVEVGVPEWMIHHVGQVGFFAGAATGDPRDPSTEKKISATTLTSMGDTIMSINPYSPPDGGDGSGDGGGDGDDGSGDGSGDGGDNGGAVGGGVFYKPLAGDDDIPTGLTAGEVCVQSVSFVGTSGGTDLYEVNSADCASMDSFCSGSSCSATVGTPLEIANPSF